MFELPPLPYADDALEPHISADTIKYHYYVHTKKYFSTASELAEGTVFEGKSLEHVISRQASIKMETALFNNVSQAWNHAFYWKCMTPAEKSGKPSEELGTLIDDQFGSFREFSATFVDAATKFFGSGWCWLVFKNNRLYVKTTPNANSPLTEHNTHPLLVCDVWEHAYYPQHPADRASYVKSFMEVINWDFVSSNFRKAVQ